MKKVSFEDVLFFLCRTWNYIIFFLVYLKDMYFQYAKFLIINKINRKLI